MFKSLIMSFVRHLLTAGGGYLVAKGTISADQATELLGAGVAIAGVAASFLDKSATAKAVAKLNK